MNSCPNIAGREILMRRNFGIIGLILTTLSVIYLLFYNNSIYTIGFFFIFSMSMLIPSLEAKYGVCIVYSSLGIKNMGKKYQKEENYENIKMQRLISVKILFMSFLISVFFSFMLYKL